MIMKCLHLFSKSRERTDKESWLKLIRRIFMHLNF